MPMLMSCLENYQVNLFLSTYAFVVLSIQLPVSTFLPVSVSKTLVSESASNSVLAFTTLHSVAYSEAKTT